MSGIFIVQTVQVFCLLAFSKTREIFADLTGL